MKCRICNIEKPEDEFPWSNKKQCKKNTRCKECQRFLSRKDYSNKKTEYAERLLNKRNRNAEIIYNYLLNHPCVECGESEPMFLDFDHLDNKSGNSKSGCVSTIARSSGKDALLKEIEKCQILCLKCHRIKTLKTINSFRWKKYNEKLNAPCPGSSTG